VASIAGAEAITPDLQYQDRWTLLPFAYNDLIDVRNAQLNTEQPLSLACQQELTQDCRADAYYREHIQPLWTVANRDEQGNACVDCHDGRGFTALDLSDADLSAQPLQSYQRLFSPSSSYMFLVGSYSPVDADHCRRTVLPPYLEEPSSDCFTCYTDPLMQALGALPSANFFQAFDQDSDDEHWYFRPAGRTAPASHQGMLSPAELKLIAEWLDLGAKH